MNKPEKFTKEPVTIEALQFTDEESAEAIVEWVGPEIAELVKDVRGNTFAINIRTLEGTMIAAPEWWIIKGIQGEFYPCKPDIFADSYSKASE
jgi:hypothetical protein